MAQVNVDLSEYDMLRQSKDKAEKEVLELKEEVKKLKDNASNVVVKNRYYVASIDYERGASKIINDLGYGGLTKLIDYSQQMHWSIRNDPFSRPSIDPELVNRVATIIERNLKDLLNLKSGFIEDTTTMEVRGFDEISETIKQQIEKKYKISMEEKMQSLDRERESYNLKHLDVDKAVNKAEEDLKRIYDKEIAHKDEKIDALEGKIKELKDELKEASKSSEEKLAEAIAKLHAAEEEVAKYKIPRKKIFGLF